MCSIGFIIKKTHAVYLGVKNIPCHLPESFSSSNSPRHVVRGQFVRPVVPRIDAILPFIQLKKVALRAIRMVLSHAQGGAIFFLDRVQLHPGNFPGPTPDGSCFTDQPQQFTRFRISLRPQGARPPARPLRRSYSSPFEPLQFEDQTTACCPGVLCYVRISDLLWHQQITIVQVAFESSMREDRLTAWRKQFAYEEEEEKRKEPDGQGIILDSTVGSQANIRICEIQAGSTRQEQRFNVPVSIVLLT